MKKLILVLCLTASMSVIGATLNPIQLLNPVGSVVGQSIVSTGVSTAPNWSAISLTNGVSGILPVANGGIGVGTLTGLALGNGTSAISAYTGTTCNNQFTRSINYLGAATCSSVANTDMTNSSLTIGSTSVALGGTASTLSGLTLVAPNLGTPSSGVATNLTGTASALNIGGSSGSSTNLAGGTAGSLPYQTASGTTAMLPVGTNGQIQTLVSGLPAWVTSNSLVNPMTTLGDSIIGASSGTASRLPIGTTNQVMTVVSGSPAWANDAYNPASVAITGGTITGTTIGGNTITSGTGTLTIAAAKTLTASNTLSLSGTDSTVMTFPTTSATIARTDAANTFVGTQTFGGSSNISSTGTITSTTKYLAPALGNVSNIAYGFTGTTDGITSAASGQMGLTAAGIEVVRVNTAGLTNQQAAAGFAISGTGSAATNPVFIPNRSDVKAGIGSDVAGHVSIVTDNATVATEIARFTGTGVSMFGVTSVPDGTTAAPSVAFTSSTGTGLSNSVGILVLSAAANKVVQRSSTNPQVAQLYNTYTDVNNGEWFDETWASNVLTMSAKANGTGTVRQVNWLNLGLTGVPFAPTATAGTNTTQLATTAFVTSALVGVTPVLSGTSGSIGGSALVAGQCAIGTVAITSSTTTMVPIVSPNTYPGSGFTKEAYVSTNGTVTVSVCAIVAGTPTASTYNVRVVQ